MELTIKTHISGEGALLTRQAAQIASRMSAYTCSVLLRKKELTVNAKSLMGVLSAGICDGQTVTILADGADEMLAACELSRLLGA